MLTLTVPSIRARVATLTGCRYTRLFAAWLVVRTVGWVAVVLATQPNAPLDLIEWLSWGHTFQWGYPKHPPLPAWLAAAAARLSPGDVWGVYLLSYAFAAGHLVAAWRLGRVFLPPGPALVGAVCLDGLMYLTNDPAEWSNNVALGLGWAWAVVLAREAIATGSTRHWLAFGLVIGLTLLCKYTIGVLLVCLAGYIVFTPDGRKNLRRPGPYLAALVAAVVFAPHAVWLVQHDFITLTYAAERTVDVGGWAPNVRNPLLFLLSQVYRILPVLIPLVPLLRPRSAETVPGGRYLDAVVLGPVILLTTLSVATGCQLREIWGSPLWTFLGVWVLVTFRSSADPAVVARCLRRAAVVGLAVVGFVGVKQMAGPWLTPKYDRPHFPGKALAAEVERRWNERFSHPFPIAAGDGWRAGCVCCYSPHRPILYSNGSMDVIEFDGKICPWTGDAELNARGGVIVWNALSHGDALPPEFQVRFPHATSEPPVILPFAHPAPVPPVRIGLALVPPAASGAR